MRIEELRKEKAELVEKLKKHYEMTDVIRKKIAELDNKIKNEQKSR